MMQQIAAIRPEIAAGSVEIGKVTTPPQQHEGFSRHLQQHQRSERQGAETEQRQLAERPRGGSDKEPVDKTQPKRASDSQDTEARQEPTADRAEKAKSTEPTSRSGQPRADADKVQTDADSRPVKDASQNKTDHQIQEKSDKELSKVVADGTSSIDDIDGSEDKMADEWLALVHKLVTNAQTADKDSGSVDTEDSVNTKDSVDIKDSVNTEDSVDTELNAAQTTSELSDKHKALLEQLGLDAEKVLQQAQATGKLTELKALLQGAVDNPQSGQAKPVVEQVLALLLSEQKEQPDTGELVAQNHALGLKPDATLSASNASAQPELSAARLQDYRQREEASGKQENDVISQVKNSTGEIKQQAAPEAAESVSNSEKLRPGTASKEGLKENNVIQQLARLSEPALDKALQDLAGRLPVKEAEPAVINSFIDNLKAGIEEFKQQRAQGREPGLDLQSLVSRAMGGETELQSAQQQSVTQVLKQFSENLAQSPLTVRSDMHAGLNLHVMERVSGQDTQLAVETAKAAPNTVMERAVNIARPEAAGQLAERVRMMVSQGNMSADIRLDPPDLGSMQIRISMNGEQASVNFVVQSQQARDMLDQAVPRLRDMLAERGIELGQSSVEQQQKDNKSGDSQHQGQPANTTAEQELAEQQSAQGEGQEIRLANGALGGIDYFV